ncbi:DUF1552 domain-containing protein [Lignipirellula cremea]|uniref:DUF1552 domain-containing protein n=1 Tax=Lignipirellula cremea TaxID=2528010 RepID=A0A518E076_9BACT|nr:DUF1552 domain-containing protein [Lignipirellula cremea]QDU97500.1 hypothetical protein Pla8534_53480 [Lignipirellula cremea]
MPLNPLPRRTFLRASGVAIALPLLEAMLPQRAFGAAASDPTPPKRAVFVTRPLGMHAPFFFPTGTGKNYQPSRYLKLLEDNRQDFTVFSGMSHHYGAGHGTMAGMLTAVEPHRMRQGDIRNGISLDQEMALKLQAPTRFSSLTLGAAGLSWNSQGVMIPAVNRATQVFKDLFVDGTPAEVAQEIERIKNGRSILDGVREQAKTLARRLGGGDRQRVDLLLNSIREAEQRLQQSEDWVLKPKPKVDTAPFKNDYAGLTLIEREDQWYDLVRLALQTDSTRVITLNLYSHGNVSIDGKQLGHHEMSHHGKKEETIEQLAIIEEAEIRAFGRFLTKLKNTNEQGDNLLDQTQIFFSSDLGNASAHTTTNLPVMLAGGGFRHAGHVAYDLKNNELIANLFVRMLQQMDIESDAFGASTRTLSDI